MTTTKPTPTFADLQAFIALDAPGPVLGIGYPPVAKDGMLSVGALIDCPPDEFWEGGPMEVTYTVWRAGEDDLGVAHYPDALPGICGEWA